MVPVKRSNYIRDLPGEPEMFSGLSAPENHLGTLIEFNTWVPPVTTQPTGGVQAIFPGGPT